MHYSVGDGLRAWMRKNRSTVLATEIQSKLDNQGFLTSKELNPFIYPAIRDASNTGAAGILIDGYPRCIEQLESARSWPSPAGTQQRQCAELENQPRFRTVVGDYQRECKDEIPTPGAR
ncbi:adenylate kinase 1 ATP binding protein [Fusarium austroafricanum]|uniref:Adenylate kinase 1 ATP binding protein n=1 Tax=Fusarium austroafricanum TaxID=2364996 RepID=A0A8H4JLU7_9HYPO|nr:adenylate kinase 1 ATP binding protein [Fusarium austroafricanum]